MRRKKKAPPKSQGMKYVRIDKKTVIEVSVNIHDQVARECYNAKTVNYDKGMAKIRNQFAKK